MTQTILAYAAPAAQVIRFAAILDCPEDTAVEVRGGAVSDDGHCLAELCFARTAAPGEADAEGEEEGKEEDYLYILQWCTVPERPSAEWMRHFRDREEDENAGREPEPHRKVVYVEITCEEVKL